MTYIATIWDNGDLITAEKLNKLEQGVSGAQGEKGEKGADGFSPTVQTAPAENGTTVTITDHEGAKEFTIKNGLKGDKGERGEPGDKGDTGAKGAQGPPGAAAECKRTAHFIVGTSTAGWTAADCDYLCDGTDDQVEINAAIQALPAEGGEVVILDGTYNIAASIEINKPNTRMSGSRASTILKAAAASIRVVNITKDYCSVDSLTCDGVKESFAGTYGIYSTGNYVSIVNNICRNNGKEGIYNYGQRNTLGNDSIIHKNVCINNGSGGINNNLGDRIIISENICSKNTSNGIQNSGAKNQIRGNTCTENYSGILSKSTCTIIGNICDSNSSMGIHCSGGSIIGNHCYSNYYDGISCNSGDSGNIVGNCCNKNQGSGIELSGSASHIVISGNNCSDNKDRGICVLCSGGGIIVSGNQTSNNSFFGIQGECSNSTFASNACTGNLKGEMSIGGNNNSITGNICIHGQGTPEDYTENIFSLQIKSNNCIVTGNNCAGKAPIDSGSNNALANNKY